MFTKNAFKRFVKQCLAEVIVEDGAVRKNAMKESSWNKEEPTEYREYTNDGEVWYAHFNPDKNKEIPGMIILPYTRVHIPDGKSQKEFLAVRNKNDFNSLLIKWNTQQPKKWNYHPNHIYESESPQEQWKDTFGNKMSGEMVVAENSGLILTPTGHDDEWSRPVYKGSDGKIYVDVNCGNGTPSIHSISDEGEPEFPIKNFKLNPPMTAKERFPNALCPRCKNSKPELMKKTPAGKQSCTSCHWEENPGEPSIKESGLTSETSEDPREAQYVEYVGQMPSEKPFMLRTPEGDAKFEYVKAKYPDGKVDIAVYAFRGDMVYGYNFFRKMMGIQENKNPKIMSFIKECILEVLKENLGEGFDPWSNGGPNGPDETGGNPYKKWNADMRKLEEDGDGFNSMKGDNPAATMKAQMFPYADQNDAMRQLETASPSQTKTFQEIRNELDPDGTKHDLTLHCVKCGTTKTCRCSKPKRKVDGVCDKCSKL